MTSYAKRHRRCSRPICDGRDTAVGEYSTARVCDFRVPLLLCSTSETSETPQFHISIPAFRETTKKRIASESMFAKKALSAAMTQPYQRYELVLEAPDQVMARTSHAFA